MRAGNKLIDKKPTLSRGFKADPFVNCLRNCGADECLLCILYFFMNETTSNDSRAEIELSTSC